VNLPENEVTRQAAALLAQAGGTAAIPHEPARVVWGQRPQRVNVYGETLDYEEQDEERPPSPTPTTPPVQIPAPQLPVVPDIAYQMQTGQVLVWFHDNSLQPLKVYRYRLGVKFLNPLLGFDNAVKAPAFAAAPSVTTPFSEWSDPVQVPQATEFFLQGDGLRPQHRPAGQGALHYRAGTVHRWGQKDPVNQSCHHGGGGSVGGFLHRGHRGGVPR
jgi:hypothetical protein